MAALPLDLVRAEHLFNLLLATASVWLVYLLAFELSARWQPAALCAAALASMPAFIGHSQNNPKDLPALFAFTLGFWLLVRAVRRPGALPVVWAAFGLGLAVNTRTLGLSLFPLFFLWLVLRWPALAREQWRRLGAIALGGAASAVALWPWLWGDPLGRLASVRGGVDANLQTDFDVLYLGELQRWAEVPWHYTPFYLVATAPLSLLLLAGLAAAAWRGARERDLVFSGALWLASLLLVEQQTPARYDGLRHYLVLLVPLALLMGGGAEWLRARMAWGGPACAALFAWALVQVAIVHPYESAYLNSAANAIFGPHAEHSLELEYWGNALQEGAAWLNENAESDAIVYVPFGAQVADHYLDRKVKLRMSPAEFQNPDTPRYLMFITRRAFYGDVVRQIDEKWQPVHEIERQGNTLLRVFRNGAG